MILLVFIRLVNRIQWQHWQVNSVFMTGLWLFLLLSFRGINHNDDFYKRHMDDKVYSALISTECKQQHIAHLTYADTMVAEHGGLIPKTWYSWVSTGPAVRCTGLLFFKVSQSHVASITIDRVLPIVLWLVSYVCDICASRAQLLSFYFFRRSRLDNNYCHSYFFMLF